MFPFLIAVFCLVSSFVYLALSRGASGKRIALNPNEFKAFQLVKRTSVSADTFIFRFALDDPTQTLGLPIGQHIILRAPIKNENGEVETVQHAYTPISSDEDKGFVEFLVKVYFPNERFPKGGRLSQYLYNMSIGDKLDMKGPQGKFTYLGKGSFEVTRPGQVESRQVDAFAMIAGGSGITPMMQIIRAIQRDPEDRTQCFLIFGNQTVEDILMRDDLDVLAKTDSRFHIWYTVDRNAPADWPYSTGFVSKEMVMDHLPVPASFSTDEKPQNKGIQSAAALMCGPLPMIKFAAKPNLEIAGYAENDMFTF